MNLEMVEALKKWAQERGYTINEWSYPDQDTVYMDIYTTQVSKANDPIIMASFGSTAYVDIYPPVFSDNTYHWSASDRDAPNKMIDMLNWEAKQVAEDETYIAMNPNPKFN